MEEDIIHLIRGCRKGDRQSQMLLFETYLPYATSICKRYLRDQSLLQDAVQETFLLVFKGLEKSFDERKGYLKAWLRKIAINTSLKFNKRYRAFAELDHQISARQKINATAIAELSGEEMLQLIAGIPIAYRDVFNLYAIDGYSHKEIANLLKISIGSSRKKLERARTYLRAKIDQSPRDKVAKAG